MLQNSHWSLQPNLFQEIIVAVVAENNVRINCLCDDNRITIFFSRGSGGARMVDKLTFIILQGGFYIWHQINFFITLL